MQSTRYSCPILMKIEFSGQIFEKKVLEYQISWKSLHLGVQLFLTDGRRDMTN